MKRLERQVRQRSDAEMENYMDSDGWNELLCIHK